MAIHYRGEYRLQGAASWSVLFPAQVGTSYDWGSSGLANGTYEMRLFAIDTTDSAESPASTTRTITISHVTAAPSTEVTLQPMLGATVAELELLEGDHVTYEDVLVADADGDLTSLCSLDGENVVASVRWGRTAEQATASAVVTLRREFRTGANAFRSLSPLMTGSTLNRDDNGAYAPLLHPNRRLEIRTATVAAGTPRSAVTAWKTKFVGLIDVVRFADPKITLEARDSLAPVVDAVYEVEHTYGSETGVLVETVLAQMLANAGFGSTVLGVANAITAAVRTFTVPAGTKVFEAMEDVALKAGAKLIQRQTAEGAHQLVLYVPPRDKTTPDRTFGPGQYMEVGGLALDPADLRNALAIAHIEESTGEEVVTPFEDAASILTYGRKFMQLAFKAGDDIDTQAEVNTLGAAALKDLAALPLASQKRFPYRWCLELDDVYAFSANSTHFDQTQTLAVVGWEHSFERGKPGTSVMYLGGKPSGGYRVWHRNSLDPLLVNLNAAAGGKTVAVSHEVTFSDATTQKVKFYAVVKQNGETVVGETAQVAVSRLLNTTIIDGPAKDTPSPSGTEWTFSRPATDVAAEAEATGTAAGAANNTDGLLILPQGVDASLPRLLVETRLVPGSNTDTTVDVEAKITDPDGDAPVDATVTRELIGVTGSAFDTPTAATPRTLVWTIDKRAFKGGAGQVRVYASAPGRIGDFDTVEIPPVEQDTQVLNIHHTVDLRGGASQRVTIVAEAPTGSTAPAISLEESLGTSVVQFGTDVVTGTKRERVYDMSRPADGNGDGAGVFRTDLAGFVSNRTTIKVPEQLPAQVAPPILPVPASLFTQWVNDTTARITMAFDDPDGRLVSGSRQYRVQNADGTWPAGYSAMTTGDNGTTKIATVDVAVPAGKTVTIEYRYEYTNAESVVTVVSGVAPTTSKLADPAYAPVGGAAFTGAVSAPQFTLTGGDAAYIGNNSAASYGSVQVSGTKGGYSGFYFNSVGRYFMVGDQFQGIHTGLDWQWAWNNGVLGAGTVPIDRLGSGTKDFGAAGVKYMYDTTNGSQFVVEKPNGGSMATLHAPINAYAATSRPVGYGFYIAAVIAGSLQLKPDGKFHLTDEPGTGRMPLVAGALDVTTVAASGAITAGGTISAPSLLINGNPLGGQIISTSAPSGTAPEGTRWAQISS